MVHINCLNKYKERLAVRRLDVVVEENEEERNVLRGVCKGFEQSELDELMREFEAVFSDKPGNTSVVVMMTIDTGDSLPIRQTPYSVPMGIRDKVRKELEELVSCGVIERSSSPWASPLVPVKKPDGRIRLCVNYRKLDEITTREPYYIPSFQEMIDRVGQGCVLSKVDLAKGFHQVEVEKSDRVKTCFVCPFGKFQFRRMPFGLMNAPSVFQRLMDLVGCSDFARCYIDDILVVSENWSVHVCHLRALFRTLLEAGLTCKREKCVFGQRRLEFWGHEIREGVVCVPEARVWAIREHPLSKTRRQLRAFLGPVGFYRRFIGGFHEWSSVLTLHTSRTVAGEVSWSGPMLEAFSMLRYVLCDTVCIVVPYVSDCFVVECEASSTGVGAVLSVRREDELKPVAFFSRQLKGAQSRYAAQELECLAFVEAVSQFAFYYYGRPFDILTDHKSLETLKLGRQLNRRVHNWALKLAEFDYTEISKGRTECRSG